MQVPILTLKEETSFICKHTHILKKLLRDTVLGADHKLQTLTEMLAERHHKHLKSLYLPLLADDGNSILQLDVVKKALEEDVGNADEVVVLLCLVERVPTLVAQLAVL